MLLQLITRNLRKRTKAGRNELLFLAKTFPKLGNGELDLETDTAGGDYFFDVEECVADFKLFEELF